MRGRSLGKAIGILGGTILITLALARAGLVEQVKPVNPFMDGKVVAANTQKDKKSDVVHYHADHMKAGWGDRGTAELKGNVSFTSGDTVLTSDTVGWDADTQTAVSPGKVKITNPECDITGDKGTGFFKKRLGVIEGNVVMLLKPKKTEGKKPNDDSIRTKLNEQTTVSCKKIEYLYRKKIATATGGVVFKQTKRTASADSAIYDQDKELLTLSGHVQSRDEKGQTFSAPGKVVISLKKGDEWMEAQDASASFKVDSSDEEAAPDTKK